jgi:hypothetical protein
MPPKDPLRLDDNGAAIAHRGALPAQIVEVVEDVEVGGRPCGCGVVEEAEFSRSEPRQRPSTQKKRKDNCSGVHEDALRTIDGVKANV